MAKLQKKSNYQTAESKLLSEIKTLCEGIPENGLSTIIIKKINKSQISIQMEKDITRRLSNPVCNVHDMNFQMPIKAMERSFSFNNQI
jgi:hypothetical protein